MSSHLSSQLKTAIYSSFFSPPQYHYHYHHLLRSPLSTQTHPKELPFIADYLISSFGFSLDRALKAAADSHLTAIKSPARPDAVVKVLIDTGLSHSQIKSVVSLRPDLLGSNADKILRPKVREMMEKGIPGEVLVQMIRYSPGALQLKDTLARVLFWRDFVGNNDKALLKIIARNPSLFELHIDKHILPKINLLKEYGLSNEDMVSLLGGRSCFCRNLDSIRQILDLIEELEIPRGSGMFLYGLKAIGNSSEGKIKSNTEFFKNTYGWSQEEVCAAFRKYPPVLKYSEEKLSSSMNFLIGKVGFEARSIALRPRILGCSLQNVLIPRYTVLSTLQNKGLMKKCSFLNACLASERRFHEIYVVPYEKDMPGLGEAYAAAYGGKVLIGEAPSDHATYIGTPGKGILAADESAGTISKRLARINVENIEENCRNLRELLFLTPGALECISGVILHHETKDGKLFVDVLNGNGILPGIEVNMGTIAIRY